MKTIQFGKYGLEELHNSEKEILRKFIVFCKENELNYYILGGTLLGAVRHEGFIPWDDDIDVGMPRNDFEKFIELVEKKPIIGCELFTYTNNKNYNNYVPKIIDKSVELKDLSATKEQTQFAWIDVFPLDGMPNNFVSRKLHSFRLLVSRLKVNYSMFSTNVNMKLENRPLHEKLLVKIGGIIPVEKILNRDKELIKLDKLLKKFNFDRSDYLINFMGAYKLKEMFHKKYYGNGRIYNFEGMELNGPSDYHYVLTQLYGDYMTPPPQDHRNSHNTEIISK